MPFTFSTEAFTKPLADFGRDSAQMILQTGQVIEQGLQRMMTNRQVQGLGQELGTINPESPEWAQQAVQLGSRYPLAMKSPAGQFMLGTQAKAHAQWSAAQKATAQMDATTKRQIGLENLRTKNDLGIEDVRQKNRLALAATKGDGGVNLIPPGSMPVQNSPARGVSFGAGMPSLDGGAAPQSGSEILTSGTGQGMEAQAPLPMDDPLTGRALGPLAAAQQKTGVKPTRSQMFSAIAQEDRQMQQEKRDVTHAGEVKALKEEKMAFDKQKIATTEASKAQTAAKRDASTALKAARELVNQEEKALNDFDQETDPAGFAEQQKRIEAAGKKRRLAEERFDALLNGEDNEIIPVKNAFEAKALPAGTKYQTPDGRTFTR